MKHIAPVRNSIILASIAASFAALLLANQIAYGLTKPADLHENLASVVAIVLYLMDIPLLVSRVRWAYWYNLVLLIVLDAACLAEAIYSAITIQVIAGKIISAIMFLVPSYFASVTIIRFFFDREAVAYFRRPPKRQPDL